MKKFWGITISLLLGLTLAGCGSQAATSHSASGKSSTSVKSKTSSAKQSRTKAASSSQSANSTSSTTSSSSSQAPRPVADRLTTLRNQLKTALPSALLPTAYPLPAGQVLNASYSGNATNYTIYFAARNSALPLNSNSVNANAADITLSAQTYPTASAAEAQINYQAPETGLPTVALGDHLTGTQQGAAGSTYLTWQEGRWSLTTQAINQNQENPVPLSRQVVALLSEAFLPVPATHGAIALRVNTGGLRLNSVTWRQGNVWYQATGVDAMTLLRVVTSLK